MTSHESLYVDLGPRIKPEVKPSCGLGGILRLGALSSKWAVKWAAAYYGAWLVGSFIAKLMIFVIWGDWI